MIMIMVVVLALAGQTNSATTLDLSLPANLWRQAILCGATRRWLSDDDDHDET